MILMSEKTMNMRKQNIKSHILLLWKIFFMLYIYLLKHGRSVPTGEGFIHWCKYWLLHFFCLFRTHPGHMEVPRLGNKSELQLPAYTRAKSTSDPSCVCNIYHSSQQHQILNPMSKARCQTWVLMSTSQIHFHCAMMGTPGYCILYFVTEVSSHFCLKTSKAPYKHDSFYCSTKQKMKKQKKKLPFPNIHI